MAFKDWYELVRDHLLGANQGYGKILYETQNEMVPLSFQRLRANPHMRGLSCNLMWIASTLWTFISRHVTKS